MDHTQRKPENYPLMGCGPGSFGIITNRLLITNGTTHGFGRMGSGSFGRIAPSRMKCSWSTLASLVILLFVACGTPQEPVGREGKGGRFYGGVFNANEVEPLRSLFPLTLTQAASHRIAAQIYEGLVGFDQGDLSVQPRLAEAWNVDPTGTQYTFSIRKGVLFHDDVCFPDGRGRELVASDVAYCLNAVATPGQMNQMDWLFRDHVVGANAHYAAVLAGRPSAGVEGIAVLDDHTVRITLAAPWAGFLQVLAHQGCWIYPPELLEHHGRDAAWHPVGTGPFKVRTFTRGKVMVFERNADYWGVDEHGNQLPFLDGMKYTFETDKDKELEAFLKGRLSVVYELPITRTGLVDSSTVNGQFNVQSAPGLSVQFYGFNVRKQPFTDVRVREAMAMAIDRQFLVDSVLGGLGIAASRGLVPPGFSDYPYDRIPERRYDPIRARDLLGAAGFPGGKGLPTIVLQVNNDGFGYVRVAEAVQAMLEKQLGVRVVVSVLPGEQHFERIERDRAQFWREGWIMDHPDPENVLALFQGAQVPADTAAPSYLNSTRYRDPVFDSLFLLAQRSVDRAEHMRLLAEAEARLISDAYVVPLYHERAIRLLQPWVMDLPINGMEYRDLRATWFDPKIRSAH
jgi:oligopeptide transport system substrate-binding protein